MVSIVFFVQAHCQPFRAYTSPGRGIHVYFYKNVEFMGFVFFAGTMGASSGDETATMPDGTKKKDWFAYDLSLYRQYTSFTNNPDLGIAAQMAANTGGSDLIRLMLLLDEFPHAVLEDKTPAEYVTPFSPKGDSAEGRANAMIFINALNRLYKTMNFDAYFNQSDGLYRHALQEITGKLPAAGFIPAMEKFYRQRFHQYILMPSLTIPSGMAFGTSFTREGKTSIFNTFGPYALQQFTAGGPINMGFAKEDHIRELSTHEFGHSFANPFLDKVPAALYRETAVLFDTIKTAMENQGYNTWKSCVIEHFVRAGEIIIARNLGYQTSAEKLQAEYINKRRFIYLPVMIKELELYNTNPAISYGQAVSNAMEKLRQAAGK